MGIYQVYSNKGPGLKIGPTPGIIDFPCMCKVKPSKIIFKKPKELEFK
jgi:hypothetical protein